VTQLFVGKLATLKSSGEKSFKVIVQGLHDLNSSPNAAWVIAKKQ
jgi:hypothetical protein